MFKRSAATLGVLAGLLAAAGPASAQLPPTTTGVKAPGPCANAPAQLSIGGAEAAGFVNGCRADKTFPLHWQGIAATSAVQDADMAI